MRIVLTDHVKTRRAHGNIPCEILEKVALHLIVQHNLTSREVGSYKFRLGTTQAVIHKNKTQFIFITFFGPTGWVMDCEDFGEFDCTFQTPEILARKENIKKVETKRSKLTKTPKTITALCRLSKEHKKRLEKGSFEIIELNENMIKSFKEIYGQKPMFVLKPKFGHTIAEVLSLNGSLIKSIHINEYNKICNTA